MKYVLLKYLNYYTFYITCFVFLASCSIHCILYVVVSLMNLLFYVYSELHDAVFVVGALDETIILRGMRYHPIDVENSVMRCHRKIAEW